MVVVVVIIVTTMPNAFYAYDPIIVCLYDKTPEWVACMHTACIPAYKIRQQQQRQRHRFRCEWERRDLMPLHTMELWRDAVDCIASRCTHLFKCYVHESPKAETLTLAQLSCTLHSIRWIFQNLSSLFCTYRFDVSMGGREKELQSYHWPTDQNSKEAMKNSFA